MHNFDFNSVEAELRDIEEEFASGRMNAFGTANTQESFIRELKRIADVETQIFYRTCAIIKASTEEDHSLLTTMFSGVKPSEVPTASHDPNPAASAGPGGAFGFHTSSSMGVSTTIPPSHSTAGFGAASLDGGMASMAQSAATFVPSASMSPMHGASVQGGIGQTLHADTVVPPISSVQWGSRSNLSDRAFDDLSRHFKSLEAEFASVGDNLRTISKHVMLLNEMSERVNANSIMPAPPDSTGANVKF